MKKSRKTKKKTINRWTSGEEDILIKHIEDNVTNLKKAFEITSKEIQRSVPAIANHWYKNTSIHSGHCLFVTLSGKHISINRKNGKGTPSSLPLYKKVLKIFGLSI